MNSRIPALLTLVLFTALTGVGETASARECRDIFSGSNLNISAAEMSRLEAQMIQARYQFDLALREGRNSQSQQQLALQLAERLLQARNTKFKRIVFDGQPALEIESGTDEWGAIAKTALANHDTKLIYSPIAIANNTMAHYDAISEAGRAILVSTESLWMGPRLERQILHELGHMDYDTRGVTRFTGSLQSHEKGQSVIPGQVFYTDFMRLDEIPMASKDLYMHGLDLSRNDMPSSRKRLRDAASRSVEVARNWIVSLEIANQISRMDSQTVAVGRLQNDGVDIAGSAYFSDENVQVQVTKTQVNKKGELISALMIQIISEHGALNVALDWSEVREFLVEGVATAEDLPIDRAVNLVKIWAERRSRAERPSADLLLATGTQLISDLDQMSAADASALAMRPRKEMSPLLRRRR